MLAEVVGDEDVVANRRFEGRVSWNEKDLCLKGVVDTPACDSLQGPPRFQESSEHVLLQPNLVVLAFVTSIVVYLVVSLVSELPTEPG